MSPLERPAAVILAGGRSSRMGRSKATVQLGGVTLIERVAGALRGVCGHIVVVANEPSVACASDWHVVGDQDPYEGPVAGLLSGLAVVEGPLAVVVACDMPFVSAPLVRRMIELARSDVSDVIAPEDPDGRPHPLHAVYRTSCLPKIRRLFEEGERRAFAVLDVLNVRRIEGVERKAFDPEGRALWSLNTPQDLARAEIIVRRG